MVKRILSLLIIICTLLLVSCAGNTNETPTSEEETNIDLTTRSEEFGSDSRPSRCAGGFVYYIGEQMYKGVTGRRTALTTMWRYNVETKETSPACVDAACSHKEGSGCPFFAAAEGRIASFFVDQNTVYYLETPPKNENGEALGVGRICSYDLSAMKTQKLCDWSPCENTFLNFYDGKLFFVQYEAHKEDEGYDKYLCSCGLAGENAKKEHFFGDHNDDYSPFIIDDGQIWYGEIDFDLIKMICRYKLSLRDLKTGEEIKRIEDFSYKGNMGSVFNYYKGCFYYEEIEKEENFVCRTKTGEVSREATSYRIQKYDPATGKTETLVKDTTGQFRIVGNMLYCLPYAPEVIPKEEGEILITSRGSICKTCLDNLQTTSYPLPEEFYLYGANYMTVYDGRIYSIVMQVEGEPLFESDWAYMEIDLRDGTYSFVPEKVASIV